MRIFRKCNGNKTDWQLKGVLAINLNYLEGFSNLLKCPQHELRGTFDSLNDGPGSFTVIFFAHTQLYSSYMHTQLHSSYILSYILHIFILSCILHTYSVTFFKHTQLHSSNILSYILHHTYSVIFCMHTYILIYILHSYSFIFFIHTKLYSLQILSYIIHILSFTIRSRVKVRKTKIWKILRLTFSQMLRKKVQICIFVLNTVILNVTGVKWATES